MEKPSKTPMIDTNLNTPGVKADTGKNRLELIFRDFPHAIEAIGLVGTFGASGLPHLYHALWNLAAIVELKHTKSDK